MTKSDLFKLENLSADWRRTALTYLRDNERQRAEGYEQAARDLNKFIRDTEALLEALKWR